MMNGGTAKVTMNKLLPYMDNDANVTKAVYASAAKAIGTVVTIIKIARMIDKSFFIFFSFRG